MPYNNTPITPTQEVTGTVSLPLARVKKIISYDEDLGNCSNNAAFAITVATELFLQYLVEQTHNVVKAERKPRRNIQYKDVANAVARIDNLEFLTDVVPRTITYKAHKEKQQKELVARSNGQQTSLQPGGVEEAEMAMNGDEANGGATGPTPPEDAMDVDESPDPLSAHVAANGVHDSPSPVNGNA